MLYPKINSLFKREGCAPWDETQQRYVSDISRKPRKSKLIIGDYACPEFESIRRWMIDEKLDGTNIRVIWEPLDGFSPQFGGRSDNAQIPKPLLDHLQRTFTREKMLDAFPNATRVVLFGEGYGPKIQGCGGRYRKDVSFAIFDAWIDGWWLEKGSVIGIADDLGIEYTIGHQVMTTDQIVDYVRSKPISHMSEDRTLVMEGVIARSYPLMLFRAHKLPIMFKLKVSDFDD